ncbi:hypothetical protein [Dactylosporangium sp. NPDC048998]|uniref:hypothetical protein n=1 Tax=Dactylosporangium sp. NPDC048998 TaxID=3363976 RepID=UPI0037233BBE
MSFSVRRIGIIGAILLAVVAFFALQTAAASGPGPTRADGVTVTPSNPAPSPSTNPPAHPDGAIWG